MSKSNHTLSIALSSASKRGLRFCKARELLAGRKAYRLADAAGHGLVCNKRGYSLALFDCADIQAFCQRGAA